MSVDYPPHLQEPGGPISEADAATLRRALWLKRAFVSVCAALVVLVLAVVAVTVLLIRSSQVGNSEVLDQTKRGTSRIEECTTPGRECFDRSQKQLADTVAGLNRYGIIVASCSSGPVEKSVEDITACVVSKLPTRRR